ncbi:MAG: hypothetical protein PWP23_3100 [Candidatus Sumerlaeota bacterium]|nr:hypothetical protein [Candidatus Sumerlaeota bacterium]
MAFASKGNRARLTRATINALTVSDPSNPKSVARLWDDKTPELHVVASPRSKRFALLYRRDGRERRVVLGRCDRMTVDEARAKAKALLGDVERGSDPLDAKAAAKADIDLRAFWETHFLPDAKRRWKPSTLAANVRRWDLFIAPALGRVRIGALDRAAVVRLHRRMAETPIEANRCLALIRAMLNKAEEWGFAEGANPCRKVKPYPEHSRERLLSPAEFKSLWQAIAAEELEGGKKSAGRPNDPETLARLEAELLAAGKTIKRRKDGGIDRRQVAESVSRGISRHAAGLFRLLMTTGCRLSEIQKAEWRFVDWESGWLNLPDSKTGQKRVPLAEPAMQELRALHALRSQDRWIIEGDKPHSHLVGAQKAWQRVRTRAGCPDVRLHDLRHGFASVGVMDGQGLQLIGKTLGHRQARTTERYAHLAADPVKATAERIAALIVDMTTKGGAEVVDLTKKLGTE